MTWTCPKCGSEFKNTNQYHSCGTWTVDDFLNGRPDTGITLYRTIEKRLLKLKGVSIRPVKTRILFKVEAAFLSVEKIGDGVVEFTVALNHKVDHPLVKKSFEEGNMMAHSCRVASLDDLESLLPIIDEARVVNGGGKP